MPRVAWIGLGNMGRGMTQNLATKGSLDGPLILYNRTRARTDEQVAAIGSDKARAVDTIGEAVKSADIIFTIVANDAAVKETYEAALKEDVKGKLFVDCTTIDPDTTTWVEKALESKGAGFVGSPSKDLTLLLVEC
jgi:3-hydroxyisobutyrate dehydrogenase-like beta-hydroxyacid dehydrogenase